MTLSFAILLAVASVCVSHGKPASRYDAPCGDAGIAKYNITFDTFWTEERFPKQFPTFRPHAQWAKLIGRTHSDMYNLWEEGKLASPGVMEYVEKGTTEMLDNEVQGGDGILDIFNTKPMDLGIGTTSVKVLADPYHSKVSVMARLIPSPDWFVGVDSLDLCKGGKWVEKLTYDLAPHDSGTDRGFTFTAPNWPEIPYKKIYEITAKLPNHPANSFFYPELDKLSTLASITLRKVATVEKDAPSSFRKQVDVDTLNDDNSQPSSIFRPQEPASFNYNHAEVAVPPPHSGNQVDDRKPEFSMFRTDMRPKSYTAPPVVSTPPPPREEVVSRRQPRKDRVFPKSCVVSEWQDWSACSKTCGYGTRMRTRMEVTPSENGGVPCPVLKEEEMCGSMRSCTWSHFTSFGGAKKPNARASRRGVTTGRRRSTLFRRRARKQPKVSSKPQA